MGSKGVPKAGEVREQSRSPVSAGLWGGTEHAHLHPPPALARCDPAPGASCTWVWIRLRPRNHRIWPRRSSLSAWSISSTSSLSSSSGISSFCVSLPASFRNLSLLVGMVAMTCRGSSIRVMGAVPQVASSLTCHPSPLSYAQLEP